MSETTNDPLPAPEPSVNPPGVRDLLIEEEMRESYLRYAMSVIVARALPDVRDGLKPSQRRILVAMNDLKLAPRSKFVKCAKIVGECMGNYHPHGDNAIYPTLVRMAQDITMRERLIEPQGNFGTLDDPPAAMRYTEARLAQSSMEMLADLGEDTVDFVPTYDEKTTEPTVLPGRFPNLLVNGAQGIAVGMTSSIPPHNVREVCNAVVALIDDPGIDLAGLMRHVPGPDFPTGATICGRSGILDAYEKGRGHVVLRARSTLEELKNDKVQIVFTEMPYGVSINTVCEQIVALVGDKKLPAIADVRDESSMAEGTRLVVELKRGENDQVVLNQLFKHTRLQETFGVIAIALVDGRPETLTLKQLLEHFRDHRVTVIRRRTRFRLQKAEERAHLVEGLLRALDVIDWIIATIRGSRTVPEAKDCLMAGIGPTGSEALHEGRRVTFTGLQADAILEMRLARLTGLEREKLQAEWEELQRAIAEYRAILADRARVLAIVREETVKLAEEFPAPRRTEITSDANEVRMEDLIADEAVAVTISHEGYVKRLSLDEYRLQGRGGKGVIGGDTKEGDFVERLIVATNHQYLLVLTQTGHLHWLRVFDVPEGSRQSRGRALVNLLQVDPGDRIAACVPVRTFEAGYLLTATAKGTIRKTPLSGFSRPRPSGIIGVKIDEGDRLIGAAAILPGQQAMLMTRGGKAIRFSESTARAMGRASVGVRGIRLTDDDDVVSLVVVEPGKSVLTVCENGYGKRTTLGSGEEGGPNDYPLQNRGGKGVIDIKVTERNGKVVAARAVSESDEFMAITQGGMVVRARVADARTIGRNTQGVRLMDVDEGDRVVSVGLIESEEETPEAAPDGAAAMETVSDETGEVADEEAPEGGTDDADGADGADDDTPPDDAGETPPGLGA